MGKPIVPGLIPSKSKISPKLLQRMQTATTLAAGVKARPAPAHPVSHVALRCTAGNIANARTAPCRRLVAQIPFRKRVRVFTEDRRVEGTIILVVLVYFIVICLDFTIPSIMYTVEADFTDEYQKFSAATPMAPAHAPRGAPRQNQRQAARALAAAGMAAPDTVVLLVRASALAVINWTRAFWAIDLVFLTIFFIEIALRIYAWGWEYLRDMLNFIDLIIVWCSRTYRCRYPCSARPPPRRERSAARCRRRRHARWRISGRRRVHKLLESLPAPPPPTHSARLPRGRRLSSHLSACCVLCWLQ
jgi:hypothetical protein